jgi:hypothetical protein
MLKNIIVSLSIITTSLFIANVKAETIKSLPLNGKYIDSVKSKNDVYDEIITDYIKDFEKRYNKAMSAINQAELAKENALKHTNVKVQQIKDEYKSNPSAVSRDTDQKVKEIINSSKNNDEMLSKLNYVRNVQYKTDMDDIKVVLEENQYPIKKAISANLDKQKSIINENFSNEESVFVNIFKNKMKEFTVTKEEKEFLEKSIKETTLTIKNTKLTVDDSVINTVNEAINKDISNYTLYDKAVLSDFSNKLNTFDKKLFDTRWKYSRSKSTYPEKKY